MSRHEIENCMEINNKIIAEGKKAIKKLTDIRKTLTEIAPAISLNEIDDEIATRMAEIDEAKARNEKRKKALKLIAKLEELEQE